MHGTHRLAPDKVNVEVEFDASRLTRPRLSVKSTCPKHRVVSFGPFPPRLVDEAMDLFATLSASAPQTMLLHGDLQHHNILRSGDAWLAIDPKGLVGDPGYEVGASFYNPMPRILEVPDLEQILARRVAQLSAELGIERARIRGWGLAQCVLNAWNIVENDQLSMNPHGMLRCAEILSRLTV